MTNRALNKNYFSINITKQDLSTQKIYLFVQEINLDMLSKILTHLSCQGMKLLVPSALPHLTMQL